MSVYMVFRNIKLRMSPRLFYQCSTISSHVLNVEKLLVNGHFRHKQGSILKYRLTQDIAVDIVQHAYRFSN